MQAVAVITANDGVRGGKTVNLRKTMQEALEDNCPSVKNVFVMKRTENMDNIQSTDIILDEALSDMSDQCEPEEMNSEDHLFILYTSGSTGKPKGTKTRLLCLLTALIILLLCAY